WWWWRRHRLSVANAPKSAPSSLVAVAATPASTAPVSAAPAAPDPLKQSGLQTVSLTLKGPLETALVESRGTELGKTLAQVIGRILVWWVPMPGGLMRGDRLDVLFEPRRNEEPIVHAIRFNSGKGGQTYSAYRFKAPGAPFARYYLASGEELELRLEDAPLDD